MLIKVGEYVRTKQGYIAKLLKIDREIGYLTFDKPIWKSNYIPSETIRFESFNKIVKNHSFRPLDLIEKDDYVNSWKVIDIDREHHLAIACSNSWYFSNDGIKSIVTKERFEKMIYEVGE